MNHKNWIESTLERELRPIKAPNELWSRVQNPQPHPLPQWKLAVALMLAVATAWALHPRSVSIESDRPAEIRDWIRARTGLDVPLAPSSSIHLCGARAFGSSAEIKFRSGAREGILLIARADHAAASHEFSGSTWTLHGQTYTSEAHAACLLCHEE
jgi:hypothetical protein